MRPIMIKTKNLSLLIATLLTVFMIACSSESTSNKDGEEHVEEVSSQLESNIEEEVTEEVATAEDVVGESDASSEESETLQQEEEEVVTVKESIEETVKETTAASTEKVVKEVETVKEAVKEEIKEETPKVDFHAHEPFDQLLRKYVSSSGKVNYKGLKTEHAKLKVYLTLLENTVPESTWSRNQKLAYWINLYNAATIDLILNNYPLSSITKIDKAWDTKITRSGTRQLTLNDIENQIIRPTFKEPMIHFAVNCAAKSCPKLLNEAFVADRLTSQMTKSAKYFVNNTSKNSLAADEIKVSKIFEWYAVDFGGTEGLINYLNKYSNTKINEGASMGYMEYDWALNE